MESWLPKVIFWMRSNKGNSLHQLQRDKPRINRLLSQLVWEKSGDCHWCIVRVPDTHFWRCWRLFCCDCVNLNLHPWRVVLRGHLDPQGRILWLFFFLCCMMSKYGLWVKIPWRTTFFLKKVIYPNNAWKARNSYTWSIRRRYREQKTQWIFNGGIFLRN